MNSGSSPRQRMKCVPSELGYTPVIRQERDGAQTPDVENACV